jgi:hypothetical protein
MSFSEIIEVDEESLLSSKVFTMHQHEEVIASRETNVATTGKNSNRTQISEMRELTIESETSDGQKHMHEMGHAFSNPVHGEWERQERRAITEEWKLLKMHEAFIVELVFEMGIMDRLYDFRTFMEIASERHLKMKEAKKLKQA